MKTSELIHFLASESFTENQAYNLITGDIFDSNSQADLEAAQKLIQYFNYKITAVLLPVIQQLKNQQAAQPQKADSIK